MPEIEKEYIQLRKNIIDAEFSRLNPVQRQAGNWPTLIFSQ